MNQIIQKRKSIRKYDLTKLDESTLKKVQEKINNVTPLYPEIKYSIEITEKTKGVFGIKAPHYLVFYSEKKECAYENIGFIGQQMDLFFSETGLGSCWLGMSKPEEEEVSGENGSLSSVICMSFGKPAEPLHRDISGFKRKPLSTISEGSDERLEAARLAPSAMNAQNWFFLAENSSIHCYAKKSNPLLKFVMDKLVSIDIGIALCHIYAESSSFSFIKVNNAPNKKGFIYMGTVEGK